MKKSLLYLAGLALISISNMTESLAQNALNFDGVNDMVTVSNGSNEISGANAMSITCWINSNKNGGPFGITGIRNNSNADFFILQLSNTSLECRFRNSSGINYDIVYSGFSLNQWQHYAFTYDGTTLRLYKNGLQVATQAASGTITNNAVPFLIGSLPFGASNFIFGGIQDETSLWNKELSAAEVLCIYNQGINPNASNLKLYYDYNHGTANSNNTGITTLIDRAGNINGTLSGFSLNGTSSNWVPGRSTPTYTSQSICTGDSIIFGGITYKTSGTYFNILPGSGGCDSIISLDLDVNSLVVKQNADICPGQTYLFGGQMLDKNGTYYDTVSSSSSVCDTIYELKLRVRPEFLDSSNVTICFGESFNFGTQILTEEGLYSESFTSQYGCDSSIKVNLDVDTVNSGLSLNGNALFANADQNTHTFQWYDCSDNSMISGATNKFFTLPDLGEYKVVVTKKSTKCSDTSACLGLVTGIDEFNSMKNVRLIPNPAGNEVKIELGELRKTGNIALRDLSGRIVFSSDFQFENKLIINLSELDSGVYLVQVTEENGDTVLLKLVHL